MISPEQLELFGLNNKEAKVYLATLELSSDSVQNIAKKARIHRVSTYDILESLITKGLVNQIIKGKKRLFIAVEPEKIQDSLRKKEKSFSALLPELKAIQNQSKKKAKVMYFEGKEGFWDAYFDRIRHQSEKKENLVYGSSEKIVADYPSEYKKFTEERLKKGVKAKIIVEQSKSGSQEKNKENEESREVKFLPEGMKLNTGTIIYGDRVMIVSWDVLSIVIIEDKDYAENQRTIFELIWKSLS